MRNFTQILFNLWLFLPSKTYYLMQYQERFIDQRNNFFSWFIKVNKMLRLNTTYVEYILNIYDGKVEVWDIHQFATNQPSGFKE